MVIDARPEKTASLAPVIFRLTGQFIVDIDFSAHL
jgi:hypothetical protein